MKFTTRLKKALNWKNITVICLLIVAAVLFIYFFGDTIWQFFSNTDEIRRTIEDAGIFGPLVYFLFQIVQIIVAPIPADVVDAVGGAIFGLWGLPMTIIGSTIGTMIVVKLSRRFGRPFVEKFFSKKQIDKFDSLFDKKSGRLALLLAFLFPLFASDVAAYLSGLTEISYRDIIIISIIGRLPMQIITNLFGAQLFMGNWTGVLILLGVFCVIAVVLYFLRNKINSVFSGGNNEDKEEDNSKKA